METQFKPLFSRLKKYSVAYGGLRAVFLSPLFAISLLISLSGYSNWLDDSWISSGLSILPNLLGFSLGTYSILFSLLTNRIKTAMKGIKSENGVSRLDELNATFFHFIFIQVLALIWTITFSGTLITDLLCSSRWSGAGTRAVFSLMRNLGAFIGYTLISYSILLILASALAVYRLAHITDLGER